MKNLPILLMLFVAANIFSQNTVEDSTVLPKAKEAVVSVIDPIAGGFAEKRKQGYAVATLTSEDINTTIHSDFTQAMIGKAAGIQIAPRSGFSGTATFFVVRGLTTFNGSNFPLYVVDGVPFDTKANNGGQLFVGNMGPNRSFDLDPNNIAKVKILKGLAATNIYGSQGRNGVVLITTKTMELANR